MNLAKTLASLSLVASLLLPAALPTAQAQKKGVGDKTNMKPSILGGAPLKLQIYNFNSTPATGLWVTPEGIFQSLPGAATVPPTGTTPITINSFRLATVFLQRPQGGGVWKHLTGSGPTAFIIAGTPPPGFKAGLKNRNSAGPGGEVPDDNDGPDGKKKKVVNVKNVTNTTTTTTTPPAPPAAPAPAPAPAAAEPEKAKRKAPRTGKSREAAEFLRIHNTARKDVGVAPLAWSDDLAQAAQEWADQLAKTGKLEPQSGSKYGENLGIGSGDYTPATAANAWLAEKAQYNPEVTAPKGTGKKAIKRSEKAAKAAHYTQMVWGKSTTVGYGIAKTADGQTVVVANYNPRGNLPGEKPYAPQP